MAIIQVTARMLRFSSLHKVIMTLGRMCFLSLFYNLSAHAP